MKRLSLLYCTIILTLGLVACGSDSSEPKIDTEKKDDITDKIEPAEVEELVEKDEVEEVIDKKDIEAYLDEVKVAYLELISLSGRLNELREASAAGEIEDSVFGDVISEEIIPANTVLVEKIEAIATPDDKTAETNDVLMDAVENQLLAFTEKNGI